MKCEHTELLHYAKGLCYNCYLKFGKKKLAWNCEHTTLPHGGKGLCKNCYQ